MNLDMNWLAVGVIVVLLVSCINGYRRGFVKEVVSAFFVVLALLAVWAIHPYVNQFLVEHTPVYEGIADTCLEFLQEETAVEEETGQENLIVELPLPSFLKEGIVENNQSEVYELLGVNTFLEYVAGYVAELLTSGIAFLLSYLLASVLIHLVVFGLDIMTRLPVLRGLNRFAGIFVGGIRGLLFVWIVFLIITVCWNTSWGRTCIQMIDEDLFLSYLYEKDIFVKLFLSIFSAGGI